MQKINKTNSCFLEKITKIENSLATLTTKKTEKIAHINKMRHERGEVNTHIQIYKGHTRLIWKIIFHKIQ